MKKKLTQLSKGKSDYKWQSSGEGRCFFRNV